MKLYKTLLAGALGVFLLLPAGADGVLLEFNDLSDGLDAFPVASSYPGFQLSGGTWTERNDDPDRSLGGFHAPDPDDDGPPREVDALSMITPELPPDSAPTTLMVTVDLDAAGHFKAWLGSPPPSELKFAALDKGALMIGKGGTEGLNSAGECESRWICNWTALKIDLGSGPAHFARATGSPESTPFNEFDLGVLVDQAPRPLGVLLFALALCLLVVCRRPRRRRTTSRRRSVGGATSGRRRRSSRAAPRDGRVRQRVRLPAPESHAHRPRSTAGAR